VALAFVVSCRGDDEDKPTATYHVTWSIADSTAPSAPTCASYKLADVVVSTTDLTTGDTKMVSAPCTAGEVESLAIELGSHKVTLEAMGTLGDLAGTSEVNGMLTAEGQQVTLAPVAIEVKAPTTQSKAVWSIREAGAASSCGNFTSVQITTTPEGVAPFTNVWNCTDTDTMIDVPYGPWTVRAELFGRPVVLLGMSTVVNVDPSRGTTPVMLTIDVP
jgi:hypothetical protein